MLFYFVLNIPDYTTRILDKPTYKACPFPRLWSWSPLNLPPHNCTASLPSPSHSLPAHRSGNTCRSRDKVLRGVAGDALANTCSRPVLAGRARD